MMKKVKLFQSNKSLSLLNFLHLSEQDCIERFEELRWKGKVVSPYDPNSKFYKCANNQYRCKNTGKYFNVKTGTVFENSKLPLRKWFLTLYVFASSKKGTSSCQLAKYIRVTQKTAWFMLHRLRLGFDCPILKTILKGFVELDETFIGGKNKNRHKDKKAPKCQGRNWKDKIPVWGAIEKGGNLIAQVVPNTQQNTIEPIVKANVKQGSTVYTDEWFAYQDLGKWYNHQIVNHSAKQYVNEEATTNRAENSWSHLKRLINNYHWISRKHSQNYVNEFTFRFNTRKYSEQDRFDLALSSMVGKRLTYQQLIS